MTAGESATWRELYDKLWPVILEAGGKPPPSRREVIDAKNSAAALVEHIRVTERAVVMERTLLGISGDESSDELREGILNSIVFSPQFALMLAREALPES